MPDITLPFLSPVTSQGNAKRPEWRDLVVEIPEVGFEDVDLAMCKAERYHDKTVLHSLYFHDGSFYAGVSSVNTPKWRDRYFNEISILAETPMADLTEHEFSLLTQGASQRLLRDTAFSVTDDMQEKFVGGAQAWAENSLFVCEGRLFRKVDAPSLTLRAVKDRLKKSLSLIESGELSGFGEAIHFAGPNADFMQFKADVIAEGLKPPLTTKTAPGLSEIRQAGLEEEFVVIGNAVFNRSIQEQIAKPEFFAGRSLIQIAWSICHANRHLSLIKAMPDEVAILSEVIGHGPDMKTTTPEKIEDIAERLEDFKGHMHDPAKAWVLDKALERYRAFFPKANPGPVSSIPGGATPSHPAS